jgi:hypothetical protein
MIAVLEAGNYEEAGAQIVNSAAGRHLVARYDRLRKAMESGNW